MEDSNRISAAREIAGESGRRTKETSSVTLVPTTALLNRRLSGRKAWRNNSAVLGNMRKKLNVLLGIVSYEDRSRPQAYNEQYHAHISYSLIY